MKRLRTIGICVLLIALTGTMLTACGSDYPVLDRELDISEFLNSCYEGSGYELQLDDEKITVSAVADRMSVDMEKSADTIKDIRAAVRTVSLTGDGLTGTWCADLDIGPVICSCFNDIPGLELENYINNVIVPGELTFTQNGTYMLKFSKSSVEKARGAILKQATKATKDYLSARSSGVAGLVIKAIDDSTLEEVLSYVVNMAVEMLDNGAAGNYTAKNGAISFEDSGSCGYKLLENTLRLENVKTTGLLQALESAESYTKK